MKLTRYTVQFIGTHMKIREGNIIPNVGIGQFLLGMTNKELEQYISEYSIEHRANGIKVYRIENAMFFFDKADILTQIGVSAGFEGKYQDHIGIGNTIKDLNKLGFECYEDKYDYLISDVDGIAFELGDTDSDYDWDEKEALIEWIFVYKKQG